MHITKKYVNGKNISKGIPASYWFPEPGTTWSTRHHSTWMTSVYMQPGRHVLTRGGGLHVHPHFVMEKFNIFTDRHNKASSLDPPGPCPGHTGTSICVLKFYPILTTLGVLSPLVGPTATCKWTQDSGSLTLWGWFHPPHFLLREAPQW